MIFTAHISDPFWHKWITKVNFIFRQRVGWEFHWVIRRQSIRVWGEARDGNRRPLCKRTIKKFVSLKCCQVVMGTPTYFTFYTDKCIFHFADKSKIRKESSWAGFGWRRLQRRQCPSCYDKTPFVRGVCTATSLLVVPPRQWISNRFCLEKTNLFPAIDRILSLY